MNSTKKFSNNCSKTLLDFKQNYNQMKIAIFGASGKTGKYIVEQALEKGHEVIAYVRRENAIELSNINLKIVVGKLTDNAKLKQTLIDADACISALGGNSLRKHATEVMAGITAIIEAMEINNSKRFIYLSSIGAGESRNYMAQPIRFIVADLFLRVPLADHTINEKAIQASELNWTIVRPGGLSDKELTNNVVHGDQAIKLKGNPTISRANVAAFILDQLTNDTYVNKSAWLHE